MKKGGTTKYIRPYPLWIRAFFYPPGIPYFMPFGLADFVHQSCVKRCVQLLRSGRGGLYDKGKRADSGAGEDDHKL